MTTPQPIPAAAGAPASPPAVAVLTVTWVAPPGWPAAPDGFCPSPRWAPDPAWPDDRPWNFWQITGGPTEVVEKYRAAREPQPDWLRHAEPQQVLVWQVETPARRWHQLNSLEAALRSIGRWVATTGQPEEDEADVPSDHPAWGTFLSAAWGCADAVAGARDHLLWAIRHDVDPTDGYYGWVRLTGPRMKELSAAASDFDSVRTELTEAARLGLFSPAAQAERAALHGIGTGADWQQAERVAAAALRQFGFDDAATTKSGADEGLDVEGRSVAGQVKYTARPVGRPVLQQLVGAAHGRVTVCFARAGYTAQALAFAEQVGMALFEIALPSTVRPVSSAAREMAAAG